MTQPLTHHRTSKPILNSSGWIAGVEQPTDPPSPGTLKDDPPMQNKQFKAQWRVKKKQCHGLAAVTIWLQFSQKILIQFHARWTFLWIECLLFCFFENVNTEGSNPIQHWEICCNIGKMEQCSGWPTVVQLADLSSSPASTVKDKKWVKLYLSRPLLVL